MNRFIFTTCLFAAATLFLAGCTEDKDWIALQQDASKLLEEGNVDGAADLAQQSLASAKTTLGPNHADVAHVYNTLAMVAYKKEAYVETEAHHRHALDIQEQMLRENDLEIGRTLTYLGDFFLSQNKLTEGAEVHERAHGILVANIGTQHPDVGRSLNNLARIYTAQNRLRDAADHHTQALAILEPALGADDPEVKLVMKNLTSLYSDLVPPEATDTPQPIESP